MTQCVVYVPGPAVSYAPCGPSPAIHSRAGSKAFLDHLQRCAPTLPAHTPWCTAPRQGQHDILPTNRDIHAETIVTMQGNLKVSIASVHVLASWAVTLYSLNVQTYITRPHQKRSELFHLMSYSCSASAIIHPLLLSAITNTRSTTADVFILQSYFATWPGQMLPSNGTHGVIFSTWEDEYLIPLTFE